MTVFNRPAGAPFVDGTGIQQHAEFSQAIARAREKSSHRTPDRMLALADAALSEPAMANAVRVAADVLKWQAQVRNPGSYGERRKIEADLGGRIQHSLDEMSTLDKARVIHYALAKTAEVEARSVPVEKFVETQVAILRQVASSIRVRGDGSDRPAFTS